MIRFMTPRCAYRRNVPTFRVLLCRAHPEDGRWCGRHWTANGAKQLAERLVERTAHEDLCLGGNVTAALRAAVAGHNHATSLRTT